MMKVKARPFWHWLVLLAALGYLFVRGPYRAWQETVDLPTFYGAAHAWIIGADPYDHATIKRVYDQRGGDGQHVARCVNPPSFFPVMAPLGLPGYQAAKLAMIVVNLAALGLALWFIASRSAVPNREGAAILFIAAALALAPVHTTISQGQHGLLVLAALALAWRADVAGRDELVGVALAIAAAVKPQMVLLFGFYYLLLGRWSVVASGLAGTAVLFGVGVLRMEWAGVDWLNGWQANLEAFTGPVRDSADMSGAGNYAILGDGRYIMIDVAAWLHTFTPHAAVIAAGRGAVAVAAVASAVLATRQHRGHREAQASLIIYALLAVGCLLAFYNRFYAATVLVLPIAVGVGLIQAGGRRLGWGVLLASSVFLLPGVAILLRLKAGIGESWWVVDSLVWDLVLLPHQVYALLAIALLLIVCLWRRQSAAQAD
jgi:hypothetical protein